MMIAAVVLLLMGVFMLGFGLGGQHASRAWRRYYERNK